MLENLVKLVKEFAGDAVVKNPDIPNEQNDNVVAEATNTVAGGLQNMMAGGGLQSILSLFGGGNKQPGGLMNNPIVNMMIGHFSGKLTNKYGIESDKAGNVANKLIPEVMDNLVNRTNDPNNKSFDLNSIIASLTGGGAASQSASSEGTGAVSGGFNFESLLNKVTGGGLDANNDGKVGFQDIISKVTGGARQAQQKGSGGGLLDRIKGLLK